MTIARRVRLSLFFVFAVLFQGRAAAQQPPIIVKDVAVEGNRRVQEAVILGRIQTKPGSTFNTSQLSEDVRSVFGLGFFDDVQVRVEDFEGGVKVTFVVVERPFIRDVTLTGNKKLTTSDLEEKIDLKLGSVYNPVEVQKAKEKLTEYYETEGYFEVQITPEVEKFADGDVRVVFHINEGRRITIDRIVIRGNKGLTDRQVKGAMATQEREWFILRGKLQRQKLDEDVERILQLYNDYGFIQARVEKYDVTVDRARARVTITVDVVEGAQYHVESLSVRGVTLFPETEIRRQLKLKAGDVFSRTKLRESMQAVTDLYSTIGRASAEMNPRVAQNPATAKVAIDFEVIEGPEVYVERINISGNVRSQDKVLRREIPMAEGDLFTLQKMNRAKQRLINLGYFESVDVKTSPGADKSKIVVDVDVKERPTGLFSIGGGFSSVDNLIGTIDLVQRNFLGRGWEASLRLRAGSRTLQGVLSFTEPWLFDTPTSAGFDLFSTQRTFTEYNYSTAGTGLRVSRPFEEYWRWHLGYRAQQDRITHLSDVAQLSEFLREQEGTRITSLVAVALTRDSRDNIATPSRGGSTSLSVDLAGLGGDSKYVKAIASTSYFKPIWFDHILSGRLEGGYGAGFAKEDFPVFERFYLGGPNTIRGFKFRELSPKDENGIRVGGTTYVLGNLEYIIPLPFQFRAAGFVDVGNVYGFHDKFDITDLRYAAGGGLRWLSPFGAIRVDYGFNLDRRPGEPMGAFHFSVGSPF